MNDEQSQNTQHLPNSYRPPVLTFEPEGLDFGTYNPKIPLLQQPFITLRIRNTGGSPLKGRLIPQVSWLILNPIEINCAPGETSEHAVQLSTGAPQNWNQPRHHYPHAIIISSNAGPAALDAAYILDLEKPVFNPVNLKLNPKDNTRFHTQFLFPLAGIFFFIMIILGLRNLFGGDTPAERAAIERAQYLTQGAQTVMAQLGGTTQTLAPGQSAALGVGEATPTSLSLFAPLTTDTPDLTATAFQPTFTPWATNTFPNPELFITEYFTLLSEGNTAASWKMLSRAYQSDCCTALGTDPYYVYARDWGEVESVTLVSAFLQENDRNPAPVQVRYQIKKYDEQAQEFIAMFWLIADETTNTLLIDVIDDLGD